MMLAAHRQLLRGCCSKQRESWRGGFTRFFSSTSSSSSSSPKEEDDKTKPTTTPVQQQQQQQMEVWRDRVGKGVGQVIFLGSPTAGGIVLASLAVGDPALAALAAVGTVASTATAVIVAGKQHQGAMDAGLLAYNGCLIGCAAGGFLLPLQYGVLSSALWTAVLAPTSTMVSLVLPKVTGGVPQWTWAFNAVALSQFLHIKPLSAAVAEGVVATAAPSFGALAVSPLVGLSQIFVVNSAYTGLGITAAICSYSPLLAAHAVMGSTLGCITGAALGAGTDAIAMGLWGYNAALTSMAVGVFFQNTRSAWMLSAGGAIATAGMHGGLVAFFGTFGSPCLTLPFCIAATGCHLLADTLPGLKLAPSPHSPEQNTPDE
eukprot:scaffold1872_cov262-Amphora_coffeaeformis.AAC.9